jgi:hypothetical protein
MDVKDIIGEDLAREVYKDLPAKVERALFPNGKAYVGAVYQPTPFTRYCFLEQLRMNADLRVVVANLHKKVTAAAVTIACEIFACIYAPRTGKVNPANPAFGWARQWMDVTVATVAFKRYQRMYANDATGAVVAAQHLLAALTDSLPEDTPRQLVDPNAPADIDDVIDEIALAEDGDAEDGDAEDVLVRAQEALARYKAAQPTPDDAAIANWAMMKALAQRSNWTAQTEHALARAAVEQAEARDLFMGMGFDDSAGTHQRKPAALKAALAQKVRNNKHLRRIALLAGRFRLIAAEKQRNARGHGYLEVGDVEHGRSVARLMPKELLGLIDPDLADAFDRGYAEGRLWQYQLQATPPQGHGPIVFCIDVSGSMEGDRDVWAKALFAGVSELALRQKRWCYAIQFDSRLQREDKFDPRKPDPVQFLDCVGFFSGGGTSFNPPLRRALEIIASDPEFKKADVIFLTDGDGMLSDDILRTLRRAQQKTPLTIHGILIGEDTTDRSLQTFCDNVTKLPDVLQAAVSVANSLYANLASDK